MSENPNDPAPKSENAISDYYDGVKKLEMQGHENGIKKARTALFVTAGIYLLGEAIDIGRAGIPISELPPLYYAIVMAEVGGFIGLALWTKTKPYTAIIVGLILFFLLWGIVVATSEDPAKAIAGGIIIKVAILFNLISALKPAKAWEEAKKNK